MVKKDLSRRQFLATEPTLFYLPGDLDEKIRCVNCGAVFAIPWMEKRGPLYAVTDALDRKWAPAEAHLNCPTCSSIVPLPLPRVKQTGAYTFFGDEAYRETSEVSITTYSLVGTRDADVEILESRLRDAKREIAPDLDPEEWRIHMKDLWSGDVRRKHPVFSNWDSARVKLLCDKLFALVSRYGDNLLICNSSAVVRRPKDAGQQKKVREHIRDCAYLCLLSRTTELSTRHGVRPRFVFDGDELRRDGTYAQPWTVRLLDGWTLNLVYPFLARGLIVDEPEVVAPGSRAGLEIADFVCFVVARYLHRRCSNSVIDIDPRHLGNVSYTGFDAKGDNLHFGRHPHYPWEEFFGR